MDEPDEYSLVIKALKDGLGNCVVWDEKSAALVRSNPDLKGFTPEFMRRELIRLVRNGQVVVKQVVEKRHWKEYYQYWYMVIFPFGEFKTGLFVEMRLVDPDEPEFEFPVVALVGAHP